MTPVPQIAEEGISFFVPGDPAPQGSKRHVGHGIMIESSKRVKPWRQDVREGALALGLSEPIEGAVKLTLTFWLRVPKSAPKRRRLPAVKRPDLDKLCRAVLDALTSAGIYRDDSQVTELVASKHLAYDRAPGVGVQIVTEAEQ